jgi:uncharacterized protein (TIGR02145 family)
MALKEKQTSLMASNNATYKTVEGVTYFKLKSEFDGDYTKHCGLLGEEIDENFYFLRGYDIESITVDEDRNLIINRVDKDYAPLIVNIGEELGQPSFKFNKETGTITVTYPDGTTSTMEGFLVEGKDIRIATDSTFNGNGTMYNPLRLSPTETTGTFAPADEYFDLTEGAKMPEGKGKGYRVVTREKIDNFGCLYPFSAVKKIQEKLTESGSQWRVPTKQDWDELLNAFECAEFRNHSANTCNWLGDAAGRAFKSFKLWDEHKTLPTETPTYGEDIAGLSFYPLGITPDRNEILNDKDSDAEGFGKIAGFWANTLNNEGNAYVKVFGYNSGKVDQDTYGEGARMSIRLVKDYAYSNYNEIEEILGFPYPTEMVYGPYDDSEYLKIWTKINLYSDAETLGGIRSEEWSAVTDSDKGVEIIYFINEWDGTEWHKKPLENGDSVIIIERDDKPYHEWRIIEDELIDTAEALAEEFKKDFAEVREDIAELSATTKELVQFSGWVVETINEFSAATEEHINRIDEAIAKEVEDRTNGDKKLLEAIQNEGAIRKSVDDQLLAAIRAEGQKRKESDDQLLATIQDEVNIRKNVDEQLRKSIQDEADQRKKSDDELLNAIQTEVQLREAACKQLQNGIITESELRYKVDQELSDAIKKETEVRASVDEQLSVAISNEATMRKSVDDQLLSAIRNEGVIRKNNDVIPGTYVLSGDASSEMVIPTYSDEIADVKIRVSDDFFNFGEF